MDMLRENYIKKLERRLSQYAHNPALAPQLEKFAKKIDTLRGKGNDGDFYDCGAELDKNIKEFEDKQQNGGFSVNSDNDSRWRNMWNETKLAFGASREKRDSPDLSGGIKVTSSRAFALRSPLTKDNSFSIMQDFRQSYMAPLRDNKRRKNANDAWGFGALAAFAGLGGLEFLLDKVGASGPVLTPLLTGLACKGALAALVYRRLKREIFFNQNKTLLKRVEKKAPVMRYEVDTTQQTTNGPSLNRAQVGQHGTASVVYGENLQRTIAQEKNTHIKRRSGSNMGTLIGLRAVGVWGVWQIVQHIGPLVTEGKDATIFVVGVAAFVTGLVHGKEIANKLLQPKPQVLDALSQKVNALENGQKPNLNAPLENFKPVNLLPSFMQPAAIKPL